MLNMIADRIDIERNLLVQAKGEVFFSFKYLLHNDVLTWEIK